jgi:inosine/xanthosine triphosphate pyrophosphatase family protein
MEDPPFTAGYFYPGKAVMAYHNLTKFMERTVNVGTWMTEKVCPFDKKPCIRERCEVFREDSGFCSFSLIGKPGNVQAPSLSKKRDEKSSSEKYKAHLFDS